MSFPEQPLDVPESWRFVTVLHPTGALSWHTFASILGDYKSLEDALADEGTRWIRGFVVDNGSARSEDRKRLDAMRTAVALSKANT